MGQQRVDKPDDLLKQRNQWIWDDFTAYLDTWTFTKGTSGTGTTVAINAASAASTILIGNAGSTAGAEAWIATTNKFWQWAANRGLYLYSKVNVAEAAVNNCSLFIGYSD